MSETTYRLGWKKPINKVIMQKGKKISLNNENVIYLVLSYNDSTCVARVMPLTIGQAIFDYGQIDYYNLGSSETVTVDNKTFLKYDGSKLDTLLNTTYYNSLSSAIRTAIVPHDLTVKAVYSANIGGTEPPAASKILTIVGKSATYTDGTTLNIGSRYVSAPTVDMILDYYGTDSITAMELYAMFAAGGFPAKKITFWTADLALDYSNGFQPLASYGSTADIDNLGQYGYAGGNSGSLNFYADDETYGPDPRYAKPVFDIDLSKVSWQMIN